MGKRILTEKRRIYLRWKISENRRKLKLKAIEYKGGKCNHCGYNKSVASLHFHHLNPNEKDFVISRPKNKNFEKIKSELDKCVLLCSNCHMEEHERLKSLTRVVDSGITYQRFLERKTAKEKLVHYKGGSCTQCGYKKSFAALCFHHLDESTKSFGITGHHLSKKWDILQTELDKCILVCANCHGEIHAVDHKEMAEQSYLKMRQAVPSKQSSQSVNKQCYHCNKSITVYPSRLKDRNFCSRKCRDLVVNVKNYSGT